MEFTELLPPTAVTHAVSLPFIDSKHTNLIVAKTTVLDIYSIPRTATSNKSKLQLIASYPLSGIVTALAPIKALHTKTGGDALLISFKDAKVSLIEWDPENHRISTISIHYYEGDNVIREPFGPSLAECESILTADPSSRCAALKFGTKHLAILPFRQIGDELGVDDGFDAEMEDAPASATLKRTQTGISEHAEGMEGKQTPYKASFVLPLTSLDPGLTHPVHLAFLHEYREPTLGILGAPQQTSTALLDERKDILTYTVFTLDLEQRASTNLVSVPKLPSDLWKVVPLPLPVGGALLVGTNELVHVDQSGKTNAVAVNEFAKLSSNFNMIDQSDLNLRLEHCEIEALSAKTGDLLIVLHDGSLAILNFKLSGRSVGGLNVTSVANENGGSTVEAPPSCTANVPGNSVFIGSDSGDPTLLNWSSSNTSISRKRSHAQMTGKDEAVDGEDSDESHDDDLYAPQAQSMKRSTSSSAQTSAVYQFEVIDRIPSLGGMGNFCFGRSSSTDSKKLEMVAGIGSGSASRLAFLSRDIVPEEVGKMDFEGVKDAWTIHAKRDDSDDTNDRDNMLFVYNGETTKIYDIRYDENETPSYVEKEGTEFEHEGETLFVGTLANGTRIVHVRRSEIRTYDASTLGLDAIVPQESDEDDDAELKIVHTSFCDPYVLVLRDNSSVQILKADDNGDVEPLEPGDGLKGTGWLSGCLYSLEISGGDTSAYLLSEDGSLCVFAPPDFEMVYKAPMLSHLPAVLSQDAAQRRGGAKETLTEILMADVGSLGAEMPYLVLRSAMDDLTLYEPFVPGLIPGNVASPEALRFRKAPFTYLPKYDDAAASEDSDGRPAALKSVAIGEYKAICIPGSSPTLLLRTAHGLPHALPLRTQNRIASLVPLRYQTDSPHFGLIDVDGGMTQCKLRAGTDNSTGWSIDKLSLGDPAEEVRHVDYQEDKGVYIVATCRNVDFYFAQDDTRHEQQDEISLRPQIPQYTLHLLSATTRKVLHAIELPSRETITSLKVMPLETSEHTHEQAPLIAVGTAIMRGQDMPAKGALNIYSVQSVVPDPNIPESGIRLHLHSREETKGAVTAVEAFPTGLVGTAQGQKIMVRGLKEDGSCLPVAFLDAQTHTLGLKSLAGTGLWMAADAWKGVWLGGWVEEPFKLKLISTSKPQMEVLAAEFLPFEEGLFVVVCDADGVMHVMQFDPENPKSLQGSKLLPKAAFRTGHRVTRMRLVPSSLAPLAQQQALTNGTASDEAPQRLNHVLTTSATGAVGLLTPLDESSYRRLSALQTHLSSVLEHPAGLNPKAFRAPAGEEAGAGRQSVVDGEVLRRMGEVGTARRAEVLGRAGMDGWSWRNDVEVLFGGGLGWL